MCCHQGAEAVEEEEEVREVGFDFLLSDFPGHAVEHVCQIELQDCSCGDGGHAICICECGRTGNVFITKEL